MNRHVLTFLLFAAFFAILNLTPVSSTYSSRLETDDSGRMALIPRQEPDKPDAVKVSPKADITRVIVKFREGSDVRLRGNQLISLKGQSLKEVNGLIRPYFNGRLNRLVNKSEESLSKDKYIYELRSGQQLADFNLYYTLDITDSQEAETMVNLLNRLDIVEIAYVEPRPEPAGDIDPPTDNYVPFQHYLTAAPIGVDAVYANTLPGGDGTGVKIIDIENYWNETHEDLERALGATIGQGNSKSGDHGTAVLGEMIGGDNGYGITGICPGADIGMVSSAYNGSAGAMLTAIDNLEPGDIMLIELHSPGPRYDFEIRPDQRGYICLEYWQSQFDALQYAWAKGIIVVEAAGNGAEDYDDALYGQLFDTTYRNSHAIMAGAGAPPSGNYGTDRSRLDFSNYGERVNLQGYGREVFTTGYGSYWDGDGDTNQYYTGTFSGTSSASPIVTGAVACLQGYYKNQYGVPFDADYARSLLNATGSAQQGNITEHIGPRPDLAAAMAAVTAPPSLYTTPIYIDTVIETPTSIAIPVWLHNRSGSYDIDFSLISNDSLLKTANWLDVTPVSGTVIQNDSLLLTATLDATVLENMINTYKGIIEISWGVSGGTLDSMSLVPVFLEVPCMPETTYTVTSTGDPEDPEYGWIEIKDIGTKISSVEYYNNYAANPLDDGSAGPIALPFDFPFYDSPVMYDQIYIGVNGGISFTDEDVNSGGYFSNFDIPGTPFSTFLSVFWNDLILGESQGGIYYYHSPTNDTTIVEWYHIGNFNGAYDTLTTFEVILTSNGNIKYQYKDVGQTGLNSTALIGLSAEGCVATPYFDTGIPAENIVDNESAIKFAVAPDPAPSGDADGSGGINILDVTFIINYLYGGGPASDPIQKSDPDCSGGVNILDISYIISYLYKGGPAPCYYQL